MDRLGGSRILDLFYLFVLNDVKNPERYKKYDLEELLCFTESEGIQGEEEI